MRRTPSVVWVAGALAIALAVGGCGGGGDEEDKATSTAAITVDGTEPENPLVPANTNETGGGKVVDALFTGLVRYEAKDANPVNANAETIDTKDSKVFTIKLKKGWKFHDGTEVKAKNYVDAWNWSAYSPNGAQNASWFEQVQGFADVNTADPDGPDGPQKAPQPKTDKMSGLKVVDDYTFEVTLSAPFGVFPAKLGYSTYSPLPDKFFADPKAFGENPIGNGPFKFVKWDHKQQIQVTRFDDYQGDDKPKIKDVTFKIYQSQDAGYADLLSNNLDFQDTLPTSALAGDKWKTDLGERGLERPVGVIQTITIPQYKKDAPNAKARQAISMAIDRNTITDKIFNKSRQPATGYVSPAVDGYQPDVCGEFCIFDAAKAKAKLAESGWKGDLTLAYNADGDHKAWTEAVCNSVSQTLAIKCTATPVATFDIFRQQINDHKVPWMMFRTGWQMDWPGIENFLSPLYRTNAASNDGVYSNKAFDAKLAAADSAPTIEESIKLYQEAEAMLPNDMPAIPLWYVKSQSGISTKLKNAQVTAFGELDLSTVEVK